MYKDNIEAKLNKHREFWNLQPQQHPLTIVRTTEIFYARTFAANSVILSEGHVVDPDSIIVKNYLDDYLNMYSELEELESDTVFVGEPCTAFPWMEGIMGSKIIGTGVSFIAEPTLDDVEQLETLKLDKENKWYKKYLEFTKALVKLSEGRFPVGQPILRGVTDTVGSIIGQVNLVYAMMDEPDLVKKAFNTVVNAQRELLSDQRKLTGSWHGGYGFGLYHLWAPGTAIWYQEDLAALLSPKMYDEFLLETSKKYIEGYDYSLVHIHPSAHHNIDSMLTIDGLKLLQLNKDVDGPTIPEMMPLVRKIIDHGKRVIIGFSKFSEEDIDAIYECLPNHGVAVNILAENQDEARMLIDYINHKHW